MFLGFLADSSDEPREDVGISILAERDQAALDCSSGGPVGVEGMGPEQYLEQGEGGCPVESWGPG